MSDTITNIPLTAKDFTTDQEVRWCPGCGDYSILAQVQKVMYVPQVVLPVVAKAMNISRAEVHGVMSFYHDFREEPAGRHVVKLCRAEACQAVGADRVADHAKKVLGLDWHETAKNGSVTLEPIFCLGLCACGPAALVDGKLIGRVDEAKFDTLVEGLK